ncbi:uncharacterized protein LOC132184021 [Corylus avellana]|uniref:uncharacterized protein LOC132184021 n=1 Tax=Corylus avellana TaxID=13451 RepID=UPI00286BFBA5|nr:uncharacterized protein LOC132184021 [Corylus avellana]
MSSQMTWTLGGISEIGANILKFSDHFLCFLKSSDHICLIQIPNPKVPPPSSLSLSLSLSRSLSLSARFSLRQLSLRPSYHSPAHSTLSGSYLSGVPLSEIQGLVVVRVLVVRDSVSLLAEYLEKWEKDDKAELVILKGAGRAFSAGGDLKMFYDGRNTKDSCLEVVYRMYWLCYHIHTYKKTQIKMDKSWMTKSRGTREYRDGCRLFVEFAVSNCRTPNGFIYCPCKCVGGLSNSIFLAFLEFINQLLPESNETLPVNTYETKRFLRDMGLGYDKISACRNDWKTKDNHAARLDLQEMGLRRTLHTFVDPQDGANT